MRLSKSPKLFQDAVLVTKALLQASDRLIALGKKRLPLRTSSQSIQNRTPKIFSCCKGLFTVQYILLDLSIPAGTAIAQYSRPTPQRVADDYFKRCQSWQAYPRALRTLRVQ